MSWTRGKDGTYYWILSSVIYLIGSWRGHRISDGFFIFSYSLPKGADFLSWEPSSTGVSSVRLYYKCLRGAFIRLFPWRFAWNSKVHKMVVFLV